MFGSTSKHKEFELAGEETFTFLARGFEFKGTLTFEGTVRIDGMVSGAIYSKGTVILGEHAVIEGDISADVVVSGGHINGNIVASEKVQLLSAGVVTGTIKTPLLSIEEGVHLYGMCDVAGRGEIRALDGQREVAQQQLTSVARMRGA